MDPAFAGMTSKGNGKTDAAFAKITSKSERRATRVKPGAR